MKKIQTTHTVFICLFLLLAALLPVKGNAAVQVFEISVEFSYDTEAVPEKEVSGYRLYREGVPLCAEGAVQPQVMSCMVDSPGTYDFTMSVLYSDETESPQSAPFQFSVTDEHLAMKGLQVLTGEQPADTDGFGNMAGNTTIGLEDVIQSLKQMAQ